MNILFIFLAGVAVGYALAKRGELGRKNYEVSAGSQKEQRKVKILAMFNGQASISNNDVEKMLEVSDATATRYMDELEKEGKVRQVGETGAGVRYERV